MRQGEVTPRGGVAGLGARGEGLGDGTSRRTVLRVGKERNSTQRVSGMGEGRWELRGATRRQPRESIGKTAPSRVGLKEWVLTGEAGRGHRPGDGEGTEHVWGSGLGMETGGRTPPRVLK